MEYGSHPNFDFSLSGQSSYSTENIINNLVQMLPNAITYRSHSLVQSSVLQSIVSKYGIKYELNTYISVIEEW